MAAITNCIRPFSPSPDPHPTTCVPIFIASSAMSISVIYDDGNPKPFTFSGNQWSHQSNTNSLYNNTVTVCDTTVHNSSTTTPTLSLYFYGTDINMYGPAVNGGAFNYTIDSTSVRPANINADAVGKHGGKIWSLEGLDNSTYHTLQILPSAGVFNFDYMTFTPVKYTTIAGIDVILDDADDTITYSSGWTATSSGSYGDAIPYKGTVTSTTTAGSTMKFNFIGASISVYGLLNQNAGKISTSFSVDGGSTTAYKPFDGTQSVTSSLWSTNQLFFHQDLVPGNHTLLVKVDEVTGSQALYIDSLLFEATASTPLSKADAAAKAKAAAPSSPSSGGLSGGAYAGLIIAGIAGFLLFLWIRRKIQAVMARVPQPASSMAHNSNTSTPSRPPVLRRPHRPPPTTPSAAEDGAAFPLQAAPGWHTPPPPHTAAPPSPTPAEMEMFNLRYSDYTTAPVSMPVPFIPVTAPSPSQYYPTSPLVDVSPHPTNQDRPFSLPQQDGSDAIQHPPGLTSRNDQLGTTVTAGTQQPPQALKTQTVVLTYPPNNPAVEVSSSSGARAQAPVRSETMNSDAPPPYNLGSVYDHEDNGDRLLEIERASD